MESAVNADGEANPDQPVDYGWLCPIKGIFPQFDNSFEPIELEHGLIWRSTGDSDEQMISSFHKFYEELISRDEARDFEAALTVLDAMTKPSATAPNPMPQLRAFLIAASLHTQTLLWARWLMFEKRGSADPTPGSGGAIVRTCQLPGWPLQELIDAPTIRQIAATFAGVRRGFDKDDSHSYYRALGAYWAAVTSTFVEPMAILLCAALEALATAQNEEIVVWRLTRRYSSVDDEGLRLLYRMRHAFAHGRQERDLGDAVSRMEALKSGLSEAKLIIREALADDELFLASEQGLKEARRLFDRA